MRNSESAYLFTLLTFGSKPLGSFVISTNLFSLCKQQQQIFILEIYKCEIRNQHACLPIIASGN